MKKELKNGQKVKIGRISYINVSPVYYGLDRTLKPEWFDLVTAPPTVLNGHLERGDIVISPVSSAAYAKNHDQWYLMPDLSISCFGEVMSVMLVSRYPIHELNGKKISLSEESASAASLVKYISRIKGIQPEFVSSKVLKPSDVEDSVSAALVIGDAALIEKWDENFRYVYDLGALWKEITGLPFVFAVWAVRKEFADNYPETLKEIAQLFMRSKEEGRNNHSEIVQTASNKTGLDKKTCERYFELLDCDLDIPHLKGLECFFDGLYDFGIIQEKIKPEFAEVFR